MTERRRALWVSAFVTTVLSIAAAVTVVFGVSLALGPEDTEPLESPLILPVARQVVDGPLGLYGPFGARNPWVIIHAPLYYRLAALVTWPLVLMGCDPVMAAMAAGRSLSLLGLGWTLAAAFRLARSGGAPRVVGWWTAFLIATSLVVGVMPYTVRPDMLGVALQTTGVFLVLSVLHAEKPRRAALLAAYAAFGLAACIKQTFIMGPLTSTLLLLAALLRGRVRARLVVPGLLLGLATVVTVYGAEEVASAGLMSKAVFEAAATTSRIHPVTWFRALVVILGIIGRSAGLIVMLAAVGLAEAGVYPGIGRRALVVVGIGLMSMIATRTVLDSLQLDLTGWDVVLIVGGLLATAFVFIPVCWLISLRDRSLSPLDRTLLLYLAAESVLLVLLCRASAGAWVNYGIQAVVYASVLAARALGRMCWSNAPSPMTSLLVALAAVTLLIGVGADARTAAQLREAERTGVEAVINHYGRPVTEFFFIDRPGVNRLHRRLNVVYDDWLYPVFEAIHLAQHRSIWLRSALTSGYIRFVVNKSESINIDGVGQTLPEMGYVRGAKVGTSFYVWTRSDFLMGSRKK